MESFKALTDEASRLASGNQLLSAAETEVARQLVICNACRYCEGFCGVFPAMTRRLEFSKTDTHYLANLCHNCGACFHACQYAPPHEFAVNLPQAMAQVRGQTYVNYAWPSTFGAAYQRNGFVLSLALAFGIALFLGLAAASNKPASVAGSFYAIFPHGVLVSLFAPVFLFVILALGIGVRRFWRDIGSGQTTWVASHDAAVHALTLKYLDGGHGEGCHEQDDAYTLWRRNFHHLTFYGFALCFVATSLGTLYHYAFNLPAPYELPSLPKLFGAVGGLALMVGTAGLGYLRVTRHAQLSEVSQKPMDLGFIALLFLTSASGMALWLGRSSSALSFLLCFHLGAVMALFATMPYSKFAHGIYRCAALLKHTHEKRLPNPVGLGAD